MEAGENFAGAGQTIALIAEPSAQDSFHLAFNMELAGVGSATQVTWHDANAVVMVGSR